MPTEPEKNEIDEALESSLPEMSWSKYYQLAREHADAQYGLRRVRVDTWKAYWATGIPFTHAARLVNESKNPRY